MEYDSVSNCDRRLRDSEASEDPLRLRDAQKIEQTACTTDSVSWQTSQVITPRPKLELGTTSKSLSSQVMEYYNKYSQNANLDQYFSLPTTSVSQEAAVKCYYSIYEVNPKAEIDRQGCVGEEYNLRSCVPRERRRWVRPPLIGQSSNAESSTRSIEPLSNPECASPELKHYGATGPTSIEKNDSQEILTDIADRKLSSPTLSVGSHKPLEWDNGADVGYFNIFRNSKQSDKKLSTIERMALTRGCSAALRLDPEGTTESGVPGKLVGAQKSTNSGKPIAHSTLLQGNASGSESEIEITPILKNHLPTILATNDVKCDERCYPSDLKQQDIFARYSRREQEHDTPKPTFPCKISTRYATEVKIVSPKRNTSKENVCPPTSPLKKSTSMNTIVFPPSKLILKRSQSELNLHAKDKGRAALPLIFNSSSSIATIVNKPPTCDKVIQTSLYTCSQESVGVQVSVFEDEKPLLPKRGTSLQKHPKGTYRVDDSSRREGCGTRDKGFSELSQNGSGAQTPQPAEDAENITGRAHSFEYFPGHVYENVPNGSGSRVSTSDTGRSHSTLPNTSSSINEKLWGDSDSLVRDLERSVNILKNLVDANKCDTEVKKRLIHHVVKRLITAKYTDDKIEHSLEENIPWNPDNARSKMYEREIFQALTKKHNTSDSSINWNPTRETVQGTSQARNGRGVTSRVPVESSSDKMDKNTDKTETDGRKARMGLRADDCPRSTNTTTDPDKSESSECFFPQRGRTGKQVQDIFCAKDRRKVSQRDSTTTTNSTPPDHNRMLLDAVVNSRRTVPARSSNSGGRADWRHITTFSERQYELRKFASSASEDSKLVSYAEMEKRNQLIWITNEISHLCNLKKLLEEPPKPERSRSSPKKSRSGNFKAKGNFESLSHSHDPRKGADYALRDDPTENSREDPWSSHGNLAVGHLSSRSNSVIQSVTKRNSCAQTATNVTGALSKTGGEIVSATIMQSSTIKLVSTGVQTVPQETSTIPALIQSEIVHYVKCPAHSALHFQNGHRRNEQDDRCSKHQTAQNLPTICTQCTQCTQEELTNSAPKVYADTESLPQGSSTGTNTPLALTVNGKNVIDSTEVVHYCATKEVQTSAFRQKEAKNQINASKSKSCDCKDANACQTVKDCACKCDNKRILSTGCQQAVAHAIVPENNASSKCDECQKKATIRVPNSEEKNLKKCTCANTACGCTNQQSTKGRAPMKHSSKYHQSSNGYVSSLNQNGRIKLCECSNDCSCENSRRDLEGFDATRYCSCHFRARTRDNDVRRYDQFAKTKETLPRKVQNGAKCDCEKDCFCSNEETREETTHGKPCSNAMPNYVDEANQTCDSDRSCKYCPRCGTAYRNVKKCSCYQPYLKGIAYELSFSKEDDRKNTENSGPLQKVPLSNRAGNQGKVEGYICRPIKAAGSEDKNSPRKNTLQDYLSKNRAEFIHNAETCREYMSEISQLRQLRRQKRIQLLAMASTSNIVKSPRISKATVCTQHKVSDEEMKKRLRKRYLRLNEVRQKRRQQEKQEEARRNKLMAKIFCKKLQQKVLRGQVDLSQSVSVISNI